jgi:Transglycosylase SLT domain
MGANLSRTQTGGFMSVTIQAAKLLLALFCLGAVVGGVIYANVPSRPPTIVQPEVHSAEFQQAFFQATKIYGKAGCGDQQLAEMTARHAIVTGLPATIIAAATATESTCDPLAISNRGAIGLMQVMPKIHSKKFDFTKINLFNPEENMTVGTTILADFVKTYGLRNGLHHYYGTGNDGVGLTGSGYAEKILTLAGRN